MTLTNTLLFGFFLRFVLAIVIAQSLKWDPVVRIVSILLLDPVDSLPAQVFARERVGNNPLYHTLDKWNDLIGYVLVQHIIVTETTLPPWQKYTLTGALVYRAVGVAAMQEHGRKVLYYFTDVYKEFFLIFFVSTFVVPVGPVFLGVLLAAAAKYKNAYEWRGHHG